MTTTRHALYYGACAALIVPGAVGAVALAATRVARWRDDRRYVRFLRDCIRSEQARIAAARALHPSTPPRPIP